MVQRLVVVAVKQDEVADAAMEARDRALSAAIGEYEGTVRQLPMREVGLARLTRSAKEAEAIHQMLTDKLQQALAAEMSVRGLTVPVEKRVVKAIPIRIHRMRKNANSCMYGPCGACVMP